MRTVVGPYSLNGSPRRSSSTKGGKPPGWMKGAGSAAGKIYRFDRSGISGVGTGRARGRVRWDPRVWAHLCIWTSRSVFSASPNRAVRVSSFLCLDPRVRTAVHRRRLSASRNRAAVRDLSAAVTLQLFADRPTASTLTRATRLVVRVNR